MRITVWIVQATLLGALLLGVGCGGGGSSGAGGFGPGLVEGNYRYWIFGGTDTGDTRAQTGRITVDGQALSITERYSAQEGTVQGPFDGPSFVFDVLADRTFIVIDESIRGRITPDGMLATAISTTPLTFTVWFTMIRQQDTPLLSDLAGTWKSIQIGRTTTPGYEQLSSVTDVEIDAFGTMTRSNTFANFDGDINPFAGVPIPSNLVVLAGGTLAVNQAGALVQRGAVSEDGNLILLAGNLDSGTPGVRVLVRLGQATASDLAGTYSYAAATMEETLGGASPNPSFGPLTPLPGVTDMNLELSAVSGGSVLGPAEVLLHRGVTPDATLTVVFGFGNHLYRGAVGPGGAYAFYGGGITQDSLNLMVSLIR